MTLRERLSLSIILILILFSINVATDTWSHQKRDSSMSKLRQAVSGQLQGSIIKENIADLHKAVLLLSSLRSTLGETLTQQETSQALKEISALHASIKQLSVDSLSAASKDYQNLDVSSSQLIPLWEKFYRQYNNVDYDHYSESDAREILYNQTVIDLKILDDKQVKVAKQQTLAIDDIETVTNRISVSVFITSIILTIGLGVVLIRYTTLALNTLKTGTIIIGGGDLNYRIPITSQGELGDLAQAFNDMSEKLQRAVKEVNKAREDADKANQAKSDFMANMSHELRTPLNAIIGYSEMMLEDIELEDNKSTEQEKDLQKILFAGKNLLSNINDVLDFAKIETGKMTVYNEEFDAITILDEVISTIRPLAEKGNNELIFMHEGNFPMLINDITKFRQIFFNLLSNSCKFTENGTITLSVHYDETKIPPVARFKVSDTGIGMTVDQLLIVFDAFVQADSSTTRKYGGTGLGLALCKQYSDLMGADISVESIVDQGTIFSIEFTVNTNPVTSTAGAPLISNSINEAKPESYDNGKLKILVIDDDPIALALTERFLHRSNYQITLTDNGKDGIKIAKNSKPDIILLDIMMPVIDGWTVLSVLKDDPQTKDIPVILLSMLDEQNLGLDLGAVDYHQKPINWDSLYASIEALNPNQGAGRVLLIDEHTSQRDVLVNGLNREGWHVITIAEADKGLQEIDRQLPNAIIIEEKVFKHSQGDLEHWLSSANQRLNNSAPIIVISNNNHSSRNKNTPSNVSWVLREGFHIELIIDSLSSQLKTNGKHSPTSS
jgi:signal transduction histidine kinase/DNA-binding response OmpR family regulator